MYSQVSVCKVETMFFLNTSIFLSEKNYLSVTHWISKNRRYIHKKGCHFFFLKNQAVCKQTSQTLLLPLYQNYYIKFSSKLVVNLRRWLILNFKNTATNNFILRVEISFIIYNALRNKANIKDTSIRIFLENIIFDLFVTYRRYTLIKSNFIITFTNQGINTCAIGIMSM